MEKSYIKNVALLGLLPDQLQVANARAELHRRHGNITFKVVEVSEKRAIILVRQGKNHAAVYHPVKRLVEIVKETFADITGLDIQARPYVYEPNPVDEVDAAWLQAKKGDKKIKDIALELGIDANTVSAYIGGLKPLSGTVRAMFYYYFLQETIKSENELARKHINYLQSNFEKDNPKESAAARDFRLKFGVESTFL